jgi:glycine/D-amino acid oxidase-like deaminating enzyme
VIIGGGFTGVASAVELAERGLKVAIVDTHRIGWGASGRNGGQVTGSLSGDEAMRAQMRKRLGDEVDDFIWHLRWRGHEIIEQRVNRYAIACDLKHGHLHAAMKPSHLTELRAFHAEAQRRGMGEHVSLLDQTAVRQHLDSTLYLGALKNTRNLHLHPLNLCLGEARAAHSLGALIFENSEVLQIVHGERPAVLTAHGRIDARQVLLAGDVYHRLEPRQLKGQIFPAMGGIVTTAPLGELAQQINPQDLAVYDCRFVLDYYRLTGDGRLLFGGGAHYSGRDSRDIAAELRPCIERTFPALKGVAIEFQWSCAMGIVMNRIPQLGKLSDNVWYCQGYSGHGIATSHIMGEIMAEALTGTLSAFDTFAGCKHIKVPLGDVFGNPMLAVGMWYYQMLEKLR